MRRNFPGYRGRYWISNEPEYEPVGLRQVEEEVENIGFVVFMRPSEFLELNPTRKKKRSLKFLAYHISSGGAICPPRLSVVWSKDRHGWQVINHEGRGRMLTLEKMEPLVEIPVCMILRDETNTLDLEANRLFAPIYADSRSPSGKLGFPVFFRPNMVRHLGAEKVR